MHSETAKTKMMTIRKDTRTECAHSVLVLFKKSLKILRDLYNLKQIDRKGVEMIAKLRGVIDTIGEDYCIIDVNGVG